MGLGTTCTTNWNFVGDFLLGAEDLRKLVCTLLFPRDIVKQRYGRLTLPSPPPRAQMVDWCSAVIRLCLSNSLSSPSVFFNSDSLVDGFPQGTEIPMSRTGEKRRGPWTQVAPRTHTEVRRRPETLGEHPGTKGLLVALFQELQSFLNGGSGPAQTLISYSRYHFLCMVNIVF